MKNWSFGARLSVLSLALAAVVSARAEWVANLPETVVTASRFAESASALPHAVSVITSAQIQASGASTVNEAIIKLLGVPGRLDTSGGGNYTLDLRGFGGTADRNQAVIVDGRRLKEDDLSATNLSIVPIETVERIEVMRGTGAVQYGEGATGGVVVVTTKAGKGVGRRNAATVGASVGSFATREAHASAVLASGGFSVDVAAKDVRSNGHRDNFASTSNNLASTVQWSNDWLRLGAQSGRHMLQSGWPGSLTAAQYASDPTQASSLGDFGAAKSENTGIFAEADWGDWLFGADANQRSKQVRSENWGASAANVVASNVNVRVRHGAQGKSVANALVLGLDNGKWANTVTDSTYKTIGSYSESTSTALYVTDDLSFVPSGTRLSAGLRQEVVKKSESSGGKGLDDHPTAWQLGVSQALGQAVTAYGHVGTSYRLATADEYTYVNTGVTLQTQTSRDLELGARWVQALNKVELRWYRSDLTNEIGFDDGASPKRNVNFDPTRRQGIELEAKQQVMEALELRANVAVREAKFTAGAYAGKDIALVPRHAVGLGANWRPLAGQVLDLGVNWVSSQSPTFDNQCSVPSYSTVDARYAYTAGTLELALGVKNLGDVKYYTLAYGCTAGVTTSIYPEAGRSVTASAQLRF